MQKKIAYLLFTSLRKLITVFILLASCNLIAQTYVSTPKAPSEIQVIARYLGEGSWHVLKDYFQNENEYTEFLKKFSYEKNDTKIKNTSVLGRLKPYVLKEIKESKIYLLDLNDKSVKSLEIEFTSQNEKTWIKNTIVADVLSIDTSPVLTARTSQGSLLTTTTTELSQISNFVLLAESPYQAPKYFDSYLDFYNRNNSPSTASIPFKQINFDPLQIKFKWCKKVLGVNICGTETKTLQYGTVISMKDVPGNETIIKDKYFSEVTDITAYASSLTSTNYSPTGANYVLTSVIVDALGKQLTFLREGLVPWQYGRKSGEFRFRRPVSAKQIGSYLYVLDQGDRSNNPIVVIFEVYNTMVNNSSSGNFGVTYKGTITQSSLGGYLMQQPSDIGGYEGETSTDQHILLIADRNGLHSINLNITSGLPVLPLRNYKIADDKFDPSRVYNLYNNNIIKVDARKARNAIDRGGVVLLTKNNEIISVSTAEVSSTNTTNKIATNYYTQLNNTCSPTNLAYMFSEEKWYVSDYFGKIHKLTKEGRYISGGGKAGVAPDNEELYFPNCITPNPIEDQTNDFRYRFIIGNEWGYETGFKLFAPHLTVPEFRIFEDLANNNLTFTFTTSTKWEFVEKAIGISLTNLKINGTNVSPNLWNTQILSSNDLTSYPNVFNVSPSSLQTLRRGWNTADLTITLLKNGTPNEIITKSQNFYWLPSNYTPPSDLSGGKFKLNQFPDVDGTKVDFIYKPITLGDKGALYSNGNQIHVGDQGQLTFNTGSNFFNKESSSNPLANIHFASNSNFTFNSGARICVNDADIVKFSSETSYKKNLILNPGYILGLNPSTLPEYNSSSCASPCYLLANGDPVINFTVEVDQATGPNFTIWARPQIETSYSDRVKWEVKKVLADGSTTSLSTIIQEGPATDINLTTALSYTFSPCSKYRATMYLGCNTVGFVKSVSQDISTFVQLDAGADETVCSSISSYVLTGFTPQNGSWSSTTLSVSPQGTITFGSSALNTPHTLKYTFTDAFGCTSFDTKTIVIQKIPDITPITTNSPVCVKGTLTLSTPTTTGAKYIWGLVDGRKITTISPSLDVANMTTSLGGSYTLTLTALNCNSAASSTSVVVKTIPTVNAGVDQSVCQTTSAFTLTGISPTGGIWSGPGVSPAGIFTPSVAGIGKQTLTYTMTAANACMNSDIKIVTVGPIINPGIDQTVCITAPAFKLTGFTPSGGLWSGPGITDGAMGLFDPSQANAGIQTLTYSFTDATGCFNSATKKITVQAIPGAPVVTSNSPVCRGQNIQLTASSIGGVTYSWTGSNNFLSSEQSPLIKNVALAATGTYNLKVTDQYGCQSLIQPVQVTVNDLPVVNAGANINTCLSGAQITLSGSPAGGTWAGTAVSSGIFTPSIAGLGNYYLRYTYTLNGCTNYADALYTVNPPTTLSLQTNNPVEACEVQFSKFKLIADPTGLAPFTYSWKKDNISISGATNTLVPSTAGNYCVNVSNSCGVATACFNLVIPGQTKLQSSNCNVSLTDITQDIAADQVPGAALYEYRLKDVTTGNILATITKLPSNISMKISEVPGAMYATTYDIDVKAYASNNICSNYGTICKVTTPPIPTTKLISQDCGITLSTVSQKISCDAVSLATAYEYRITDVLTGVVVVSSKVAADKREINLLNLAGVQFNKEYNIDVRTQINSTAWSAFGTICKVKTTVAPIITVTGLQTICGGSVADLQLQSSPTGASFVWTASLTSGSVTGASDDTGDYILQQLNGSGKITYAIRAIVGDYVSSPTNVVITVNPMPDLIVTNPTPVMAPATVDITTSFIDQNYTTGTVSYWNDYATTIPLTSPAGVDVTGIYQIKKTATTGGCSTTSTVKVTVKPIPQWVKVSAGAYVNLAINIDGSLWGWGGNQFIPTRIDKGPWKEISTYSSVTLCIKQDGSMYSAGQSGSGALGLGLDIDYRAVATRIGTEFNWNSIAAGQNFCIALKSDGSLWGWGYGGYGQMGNGTLANKNIPTRIGAANDWIKISVGQGHVMALKSNGTLWAWGYNLYGQLGDGTTANKLVPIQIGSNTDWLKVSCGSYNSYAIKQNGSLYSWGSPKGLGFAGSSNIMSPTLVSAGWREVDGGLQTFALGIKTDGSVWSWGSNPSGNLGDGTTIDKQLPVNTSTTDVVAVEAGDYFSFVLRSNGGICGTGLNNQGQLGDGTTLNKKIFTCSQELAISTSAKINWNFDSNEIRTPTMDYFLGQNSPNPAEILAEINYEIPKSVSEAFIVIKDIYRDNCLLSFQINGKSNGSIKIDVTNLPSGIYPYSLVLDGKVIKTKKMAVIK
jgi:alpha-tubulin suppressor-like RCC1 family protein